MLLQFKCKNHSVFYNETILDLTATQEKNYTDTLFDIKNTKVLPIIEIHGANASGKTSILDALAYMFYMIKFSNKMDVNDALPTVPFAFSEKAKKENSEYEISIIIEETEYRYGFSLNANSFVEEWLYKKKISSGNDTKQKTIFERDKDKVTFAPSYNKYKGIWNFLENSINLNINKSLVLSNIAIKEEKGELRSIYDYITKSSFKIDNNLNQKISINILKNNTSVYVLFEKLLKEFDPCLIRLDIKEDVKTTGEKTYNISGVHRDIKTKKEKMIPLSLESSGTIKMFDVLPSILINLEVGGILCFDELDTKLHPLLFRRIVNMYKDKNINKNNAQIIYTSHSTVLLNSKELRRDEIYFVEKNNLGISTLYSLSEFRNIRIDSDYEKRYLTGEFGAIPFIEE